MPQCNNTSTEWHCKCNRKINDDNKKKSAAGYCQCLQYPHGNECVTTHVRNVWMFQCDCCRLLLSTGTCIIWFSCKLPDTLVRTLAVPGAVWARPSSQNAAASNLAIRPSVCLRACANTRRGRILFATAPCTHSAVTVQSDGNFALCLIRRLTLQIRAGVWRITGWASVWISGDWQEALAVSRCLWATQESDWRTDFVIGIHFFFYEIFWMLCRFCSVWF